MWLENETFYFIIHCLFPNRRRHDDRAEEMKMRLKVKTKCGHLYSFRAIYMASNLAIINFVSLSSFFIFFSMVNKKMIGGNSSHLANTHTSLTHTHIRRRHCIYHTLVCCVDKFHSGLNHVIVWISIIWTIEHRRKGENAPMIEWSRWTTTK